MSPRFTSFRAWTAAAIACIAVITVLHYATHGGVGGADSHTLFRRLYYLPIAVLAVIHGVRGGGAAGVVVALVYAPHAFMGGSMDFLGVHLHADPSPLVEKVSETLLYIALGVLVGVTVDRARRAQAELLSARTELERGARLNALGRLVAGVAHEVKNPLAAMHTTAELILDELPEGHPKHRVAELHLEETKRLQGVVDRFLSFAKPRPLVAAAVELAEVLERVEGLTASTATGRTVALDFDGEGRARIDADHAVQLLLNLVLNAVEASPSGATVSVRGEVTEAGVVFIVDDDGQGVDAGDREHLFEPFFTTSEGGSGLGLSEARQIALAHGGDIEYEPRAGGGSRFTARLATGEP